MQSIELTFDPETDAAIRAQWDGLASADLPSLASHAGATNRPHVTLAAGDSLVDAFAERGEFALPIEARFGGILLFSLSKGRFVLARAVVVSSPLLAMHSAVHAAVSGVSEQTVPGAWSPHVTLSRRLTRDQVAAALPLLGDIPPGAFTAVRLWDSVEKTITPLAG